MSKPEKISEIGVLPISAMAWALAFAPMKIIFPSKSSLFKIGFLPALIALYEFITSEAEYFLCE